MNKDRMTAALEELSAMGMTAALIVTQVEPTADGDEVVMAAGDIYSLMNAGIGLINRAHDGAFDKMERNALRYDKIRRLVAGGTLSVSLNINGDWTRIVELDKVLDALP
jgi:hypothetical protein